MFVSRYLAVLIVIMTTGLPLIGCGESKNFSQKIHLVSNLKMIFPGVDGKDTELVLNYDFMGIDQDKRTVMEVTVASIRATLKTMGQNYAFDSEKNTDTPEKAPPLPEKDASKNKQNRNSKITRPSKQERYATTFAGLKGQKYKILLDKEGRVVKLFDMDEKLKRIAQLEIKGGMLEGDQVMMILSENNLREYASLGEICKKMRKNEKKPGTKWNQSNWIWLPHSSEIEVKKIFTLNEPEKKDGKVIQASYNIAKMDKPTKAPPKKKGLKKRKHEFSAKLLEGNGDVTVTLDKKPAMILNEKLLISLKTDKNNKLSMGYVIDRKIEVTSY